MADLDEAVLEALTDSRVDVSIEFRRAADGTKSGTLRVGDHAIHLESAEAMNLALARLVQLGFTDKASVLDGLPTTAAPPRVATTVLVAGVDGYRKGWVAVSLDPSGDVQVSTHSTFAEVLSLRARVIAVDIPIDPDGLGARPADAAARYFIGRSASSVFPTPPREALVATTFAKANVIARGITGKGISQQAYALGRKILEVHDLAAGDERVIEIHPEVSFRALARSPLAHSKHTPEGLAHRRALLRDAGIELPGAVASVPEADLLDAAAGAWSAARYAQAQARAFPEQHADRLGAIWA